MRAIIPVFLALLALSCAHDVGVSARGITDDEIGLSKVDVTEVADPDPVDENTTGPGEAPLLPRAFPGAPPQIPHGIADFVPITPDSNLCVDCHMVDVKSEGEPTPIPESHYTDLRNAPSDRQTEVVGARYRCTTCHVARTGASPLVANQF